MNCVICDLGFATKLNGSKYYANGEEQHAEVKSINDVRFLTDKISIPKNKPCVKFLNNFRLGHLDTCLLKSWKEP